MKRFITASLVIALALSLFAACKPAEKQPSGEGHYVDENNITYLPYNTPMEKVTVGIFGDAIVSENSFGDLVRLFAETDGFTVDFVAATFDNSGKAGLTSSYNLYELCNWSMEYTTPNGFKASGSAAKLVKGINSDTPMDYLVLSTGRDRTVIGSDHFAKGSTLAASELYKAYKETNPDGKVVLLAPPAYQDGSVAFDTEYKVSSDKYSKVSENAKTSAQHSAVITEYAKKVGNALSNDCSYSLMNEAFEFFYANYADSGINLYHSDKTFTSTAGSYYMAAILYGSLFGKSTVGMPVYGYLDAESAKILQNAAHDFLFDTDPSSVKRDVNYAIAPATIEDIDQSNKPVEKDCYANEVYGEDYQIILATAYSFYARGKWIQYDNITNSNTYAALLRRDIQTRAEDSTPQNTSYLDCSSFVYSVYNNAYGYNFDGANNTNMYLKRDIDRVYYWSALTTDWTDEEAIAIFLETLQPGDVVVYTGHAILYMGNGKVLHCISEKETVGGKNYNPDSGVDAKEIFGGIVYDPLDIFVNPDASRFVFTGTNEVAVFRPLDAGITPTEEGVTRAAAMRGITAYKTTTAPAGITVNNGDQVTISFTVKNDSTVAQRITLTDVVAQGLSFVSGDFKNDGGNLSLVVDLPAGFAKTVSYTVSVNSDVKQGTLITCNNAKANGIILNTTTINVNKTLTAEQQAKIAVGAKSAAENAETTAQMIIEMYKTTLGKEVSFGDEITLLMQCLDITPAGTSGIYIFTDTEGMDVSDDFSNDLIPYNLYGGKLFSANSGPMPYTENPTMENLLPGDILILAADGKASDISLYLCTQKGRLAAMIDGEYVEYSKADSTAIIESVFMYSHFCVARPSMCNRAFNPDDYATSGPTERDTNILIFGDHLLGLNNFSTVLGNLAKAGGNTVKIFTKAYDSKPTSVASRLEFYELFSYDSKWNCTGWLAGNSRASAIANYFAENNVEYAILTIGRRDTLNSSDVKHTKAISAVEWLGKTYPNTKFIIVEEPPYVSGTFNNTFTGSYKIGVAHVGTNPTIHLRNIGTYITKATSKITNCAVAKAGTAMLDATKAGIAVYSTEPNYNALPNVNGTYLTACSVYKAIFDKSPVGLPATGGVDAETATALQNIIAK